MICLLQRVRSARVDVDDKTVGEIGQGLLVFVGVQPDDDADTAARMVERLLNYRVFGDVNDKMNLSLRDVDGGLLLVPQFTLAADTRKGRRPSFTSAASPAHGEAIFHGMVDVAKTQYAKIQTGSFAANMQVHLVNDGPVTFIL